MPRVRRRTLGGGVALAVVAAGALAITLRAGDDDGDPAPPSPLFDDVEQLTPTALPDGWARCSGGPSTRPEATEEWWAQTFGPVVDGTCTPLITVTQIPPGDHVAVPGGTRNGGIGEEPGRTGAKHWSDEGEGSRGLYTTASGGLQVLVVEGCCGEEATGDDFDLVAEAARDGSREVEPSRCTSAESDLDQESFLDNYFGRLSRVHDRDGCPIRADIVSWRTEPPDAHCWQDVTFLSIGSPVGAPMTEATARRYVRDPHAGGVLEADVPAAASDTGYGLDGWTLWIDPSDDSRVYAVRDDVAEAWPRDQEQRVCA